MAISPKNLMPEKCTYTSRIVQPRFKSVANWSIFIVLECSHDAVFKMCRLEIRLQIKRFQSPSQNVLFSSEHKAYQSHFSPFQVAPVSCERSLSWPFFNKIIVDSLKSMCNSWLYSPANTTISFWDTRQNNLFLYHSNFLA